MKITRFFSTMVAILIAAMSVGFTSCKDDKEPEIDYSQKITGKKWYANYPNPNYYIEFKTDGTYFCATPDETLGGISYNGMYINGTYSIREIEETTTEVGLNLNYPATLFKMLVSGSNDFDQLWVYHYRVPGDMYLFALNILFYQGNELVRNRGFHGEML